MTIRMLIAGARSRPMFPALKIRQKSVQISYSLISYR